MEIFVTTQFVLGTAWADRESVSGILGPGISKTVNLPNEATHDDVSQSYRLSFDAEKRSAVIKNLTVYRDALGTFKFSRPA